MYKVEVAFSRSLRMDLLKADIVVVVSDERGKMGELRISRSSLDWWGRMVRTRPTRLNWDRFAELMNDPDLPRRRRSRRPVRAKKAE